MVHILKGLLRDPGGLVACFILAVFVFLAVAGPWITPFDPDQIGVGPPLSSPSNQHFFGTDELGRDQLSRVIDATQVAVAVSILSVTVALVVGGLAGLAAGYAGRWIDRVVTGTMDVLFAFPTLLLAIVVVTAIGSGLLTASLAIAIVYTPRFARVARGATLSVQNELYIDAARLSRISHIRISLRHVIPNILAPMTVLAALSMSTAQLAYAALSFLGLGASPPQADYGSMLSRSRNLMTVAPWLVIFPSVALVLLIVGFNLFGDSLRDILDPKSERGRQTIKGVEATI